MSLDAAARDMLKENTRSGEVGEWDAAWNVTLATLFPMSQSYAVFPRKRIGADGDLIFEVAKITTFEAPSEPRRFRIVVVVEIKNPQQWDSGKEKILQQLGHQTDLAFKSKPPLGPAKDKLFWIATIGPHWVYGEKKKGQRLKPLIEWHHTTFDDAPCLDLEKVVELVGSLDE